MSRESNAAGAGSIQRPIARRSALKGARASAGVEVEQYKSFFPSVKTAFYKVNSPPFERYNVPGVHKENEEPFDNRLSNLKEKYGVEPFKNILDLQAKFHAFVMKLYKNQFAIKASLAEKIRSQNESLSEEQVKAISMSIWNKYYNNEENLDPRTELRKWNAHSFELSELDDASFIEAIATELSSQHIQTEENNSEVYKPGRLLSRKNWKQNLMRELNATREEREESVRGRKVEGVEAEVYKQHQININMALRGDRMKALVRKKKFGQRLSEEEEAFLKTVAGGRRKTKGRKTRRKQTRKN